MGHFRIPKSSPGESVYARILTCKTSFVPLVGSGRRLGTVVNRYDLANKIALFVLKELKPRACRAGDPSVQAHPVVEKTRCL
jgi:hypothetical protein